MVTLVLGAAFSLLVAGGVAWCADLADQVNLFTGTAARTADFGTGGGAGNTFPGAVAPFGMLQWSPDTVPGTTNFAGGYTWDDRRIRGFSLTHLSGAGCAIFQDVPILPTTVPVITPPAVAGTYDVAPEYIPSFDHADEQAAPGFYGVRLDPGTDHAIDVALAARTRSGVAAFGYPPTPTASLLFNAGGSGMANGDVTIQLDPARGEVSGSVESGQFCYHRDRYTLYFVVRLSRPFAGWGTWTGQTLAPGSISATAHTDHAVSSEGRPRGGRRAAREQHRPGRRLGDLRRARRSAGGCPRRGLVRQRRRRARQSGRREPRLRRRRCGRRDARGVERPPRPHRGARRRDRDAHLLHHALPRAAGPDRVQRRRRVLPRHGRRGPSRRRLDGLRQRVRLGRVSQPGPAARAAGARSRERPGQLVAGERARERMAAALAGRGRSDRRHGGRPRRPDHRGRVGDGRAQLRPRPGRSPRW